MFGNKRAAMFEDEKPSNEKKQRIVLSEDSSIRRITCFEDLSNELLCEIFDYLDGAQMIKAFSNLNGRFENVVNNPNFPIKLETGAFFKKDEETYWKDMVLQNAHRLLSLSSNRTVMHEEKFDPVIFNESFKRLESVAYSGVMTWKPFRKILRSLNLLPQLYRVNIELPDTYYKAVNDTYHLLLSLPNLKTLIIWSEFRLAAAKLLVLSDKIIQRPSSLQCLTIGHSLTINDLLSLLQFTPHLCQLKCDASLESNEPVDKKKIVSLSNLKSIKMRFIRAKFDEFEKLLKMIGQTVRVLELKIIDHGMDYLNVILLEEMMRKFVPNLQKFSLECHVPGRIEYGFLNDLVQQLNKPFWLQLHSPFTILIRNGATILTFVSKTKPWFEMHRRMETESCVAGVPFRHIYVSLTANIWRFRYNPEETIPDLVNEVKQILNHCYFDELKIKTGGDPLKITMALVEKSSDVDSLTLGSDFSGSRLSSAFMLESSDFASSTTKITKLKIENFINEEQINNVLNHFSHLEYFETGCKEGIDLVRLINTILIDRTMCCSKLRSICFIIKADNKITEMLRRTIGKETKIHLRTLERVGEKIFLQWIWK